MQETLSFDQALQALLAAASAPLADERIALDEAAGRVLSQPVYASMAVPEADNSAMDGYAVRLAEVRQALAGNLALPVSQTIYAGYLPEPLAANSVARIFTGALIPAGTDAVLMQELANVAADGVRFSREPNVGEAIRRRGDDIGEGGLLLGAGTRLNAAKLGLLASIGQAEVDVWQRLKVAVFFTGDELQMPGQPLQPGKIYNSNRFVLLSLLRQMGCQAIDLGLVKDNLEETITALRQGAAAADVVITCGGVSVGDADFVKAAVQAEGALALWKIAMKPGKPLAFGTVGKAAFVGLPGNPVSSWVTFITLVRPYLQQMQGITKAIISPGLSMRADFDYLYMADRREFLRVRRNSIGGLDLFANQGSAVLTGAAWADGLVDNPPGEAICRGQMVTYLPLTALFD